MESQKVFRGRSLLCLVVVSLLYLIDNTQGFSSNLTHPTENSPTKEIQESSVVNLTKLSNSNRLREIETMRREEGGRHLFLGPNVHRKRKPVLIPRNTQKSSSSSSLDSSSALVGKMSSKPKANPTLSDKMDDGEFSFDNRTETDKRNRTVISHDKADPVIVEEDNFCPEGRGANPLQSTLPLLIFLLNAAAHVIGLIVFLYYYKAFYYYEVVDPYAKVSPYGIGPPTPAPPPPKMMRRSRSINTDQIENILNAQTLSKSIVNHINKKKHK